MTYDPDRHHRRSIRLKDYDYAQEGAYFVTLCAQDRACLFGTVVDDAARLNDVGQIVAACWTAIPDHFPYVVLDAFVVMPNHMHGIIIIDSPPVVGARHAVPLLPDHPQTESFGKPVLGSLPTIVRSFKSAATKRVNLLRDTPGAKLWQRNYWERVIRDERELNAFREYIFYNPARWTADRYHPGQ